MLRRTYWTIGTLLLAGGCMKPPMDMGPPKKPAPAPEMKSLERMIGNWIGTAEMVSPSVEEMKKSMPPGSKEPQSTYATAGKAEWVMGGTAVKFEGWYEMGEGQKANYVEYWWWDAKAKKYGSWAMTDWGEVSTAWSTPCKDCDGFCSKGEGKDTEGNKKRIVGCMVFLDKDTMNWTYTEHGPMGKMTVKGTSKRQK